MLLNCSMLNNTRRNHEVLLSSARCFTLNALQTKRTDTVLLNHTKVFLQIYNKCRCVF